MSARVVKAAGAQTLGKRLLLLRFSPFLPRHLLLAAATVAVEELGRHIWPRIFRVDRLAGPERTREFSEPSLTAIGDDPIPSTSSQPSWPELTLIMVMALIMFVALIMFTGLLAVEGVTQTTDNRTHQRRVSGGTSCNNLNEPTH